MGSVDVLIVDDYEPLRRMVRSLIESGRNTVSVAKLVMESKPLKR